jgi:RNase P subunit RPR2
MTTKTSKVNAKVKTMSKALAKKASKAKPGFPKPDHCKNCGSVELEFCDDGESFGDYMTWVCERCGTIHKSKDVGPGYSDKLEADIQISTEEAIAAAIADHGTNDGYYGEEDCARLGRDILKLVLGRFRPDLFDIK